MIQNIENHTNRHALQQDLRQNQSFNLFSPESKHMIRDVPNIELCELLETEPNTQCTVCLSYWNIGIVYCTCGYFLRKGRGANQQFIKYAMDLLSIPEYVIKKRRPHGHRYGKKPGDREYFSATQCYLWLTSNKQGSNIVPVTHRPDFKQALSTLQQLKQKEEGALQTSTNSRRNQQWAQSFFFMVELARFTVDSFQ